MLLEIDFNSEEAIYIQLRNQIIYGIATQQYREGDSLPSVRAMAEEIGINMHTVNKAYSILRQEGLLKLDRRTGAIISFDIDKEKALQEMREELTMVLTKGHCKGITREEAHQLLDEIMEQYED